MSPVYVLIITRRSQVVNIAPWYMIGKSAGNTLAREVFSLAIKIREKHARAELGQPLFKYQTWKEETLSR